MNETKKNTKFIFYWTSLEYGSFNKTIFQTILEGQPFNNNRDIRDWFDKNYKKIYNDFEFNVVFDYVTISFEPTDEEPTDITIIETQRGRLSFQDETTEAPPKEIKDETLNEALQEINKLRKNIYDLEGQLTEESILRLKAETANLNRQIDEFKKENAKLEKEAKKTYPSAFIEPNGNYHDVGFAQHNEWAREWLRKNDPTFDRHTSHYAYEELEKRGWARILGWTDPPSFSLPSRIGPKLRKSLKTYCQNNGVRYPERIEGYS